MPGIPATQQFTSQDALVAGLGDFPSEQDANQPLMLRSEGNRQSRHVDSPAHPPAKIWFETVKPKYVAPEPERFVATRALDAWTASMPISMRQAVKKMLFGCAAVAALWTLISIAASLFPASIPAVRRPAAPAAGAPPRLAIVNRGDAGSAPRATSGTARVNASASRVAPVAAPAASRQSPGAARPAFTGSLTVRSVPSGAVVLVDQQPVGRTPLSTRMLRAGAHAIWIEHDGYQRWSAAIHVPANAVTQVAATLNRSTR